ncbi:2-oxoglutarate dehydrogenase, E2 component, dihydrolipoamide succinyltransferase [Longibacter salinarum]|uniref:Dihydrolipoamide acetyltransferase component of pyruvate dehydrogenase complex n=1 Tax=Longibacter salinarum TaxID=1850348 RepID=A0A2A8CYJ4_9BACT|nr:2-oxoglutarate dehydrogenase, E2 component, dihydrolipoamide succinyltransferase [Longibacter salinarum]PEN13673.1 2-oxoglutarate dehydrogenase, E2 component, dihydrolipoamide succinyltransferase [Longibacter salinarum]
MAKVDVEMPKMGESITEGTVIVWHKQPGDEVEQDETLLEIGTDKVDTEVPSPEAGTLTDILVEEGDTVEVGTIIARIETEADAAVDAKPSDAPEDSAGEDQEAAVDDQEATEVAKEQADADSAGASGGEDHEIVMPKMGESITEGTIIAWHKEIGDEVDLDETILEIGTDKVDTEVPSPAAGVLKERLVEEGETVEVGTPIAVIGAEAGSAAPQPSTPAPDTSDESQQEATQEAASAPTSGDGAVASGEPIERRGPDGSFYSPLVRSIAEEEGLSMSELQSIEGSGREGRVTKEDVLDYLETREAGGTQTATETAAPATAPSRPPRPSRPAPSGGSGYKVEEGPSADELRQRYDERVEIVEMDRMRKITAEHMVRSKATSAHVTSFAEADVTGLVKFREKNKQAFQEREGIKLTFTPFFVKAAVEALRKHPVLNASVEGDKIVMKKDYHVGIAVAIGKKGLMAPVIRDAGNLNLTGLASKAANIADRARNKQLQPDELQGGTFTVTNIGSLGSLMGTPIINQPQVGILATGAIKKRPVVVEDPDMGDVIAVRHMMYLSLSYDHRIIDGSMGSSFLHTVVDELESISPDDNLL